MSAGHPWSRETMELWKAVKELRETVRELRDGIVVLEQKDDGSFVPRQLGCTS